MSKPSCHGRRITLSTSMFCLFFTYKSLASLYSLGTLSSGMLRSVYDSLRLQFPANRVLADGTNKYHNRLCGPIPPVSNTRLELTLNTLYWHCSMVSLLTTFIPTTGRLKCPPNLNTACSNLSMSTPTYPCDSYSFRIFIKCNFLQPLT